MAEEENTDYVNHLKEIMAQQAATPAATLVAHATLMMVQVLEASGVEGAMEMIERCSRLGVDAIEAIALEHAMEEVDRENEALEATRENEQ